MKKVALVLLCLILCACVPIPGAMAATDDDIEGMLPVFDSIMRAMMYGETRYDPLDPEFFWEAVYYMAVDFTFDDSGGDVDFDCGSSELILSAIAVREMAIALFADYEGLLPIPDTASYLAEYDDEMNAYRFSLSDAGDSFIKIDRYELSLQNFVFVVYASLVGYDEDETLLSVKFELLPNTDSGDIIVRYYPYSVISAELVS